MSSPLDPDVHTRAQDQLASLALGEAVDPAVTEHVAHCSVCQDEVAAYRRVVDLARSDDRTDDDELPPPGVWDRIEAAVTPPRSAPVVPLAPRRDIRRVWLAAAAAVLVLAGGLGGWVGGRDSDSPGPARAAQAALRAQPGLPENVHGTATVHTAPDGYRLDVRTRGLPARDGYYEVWLYDPSVETMVAVGTLGTGGRGTFTVPAGIDLSAFRVVDVSAQNYDGNAAHQRSVLRGQLSR